MRSSLTWKNADLGSYSKHVESFHISCVVSIFFTHLIVVGNAAVGCGSCDLWCGCSEVTRGHDTWLGYTQTQDQVVSPQGDVTVTGACCAGFLGINWAAAKRRS